VLKNSTWKSNRRN